MTGKFSKYIKERGPVMAAAAALAIGNGILPEEDAPQYEMVEDPHSLVDRGRILTPEELHLEYEIIGTARDIYQRMATTREEIWNVTKFLGKVVPNMAIMKAYEALWGENVSLDDLEKMGIERKTFSPLVDLGAFPLQKVREGTADFSRLKEAGIRSIVIMEDRAPHFYLNYGDFDADATVPLNRHGNADDVWTMADLKKLVDGLHEQDIKVVIGFWGNTAEHEKNPFVNRNWDSLKPVVPYSDDINPLSFVEDEHGEKIPFGDYIVQQYTKLNADFGFDGLFLGDGLMGFRSFLDPHGPYNFAEEQYLWTDFYRRVYNGLKEVDEADTLWAYDCMANGPAAARRNGVSLESITPYIDHYIFQSYGNDAWGKDYMKVPGYDVHRDEQQIASLPPELKKKVKYSIGLGDAVEHWKGRKKWMTEKHMLIGPHAGAGTLGVWSTEIFSQLFK